jgi:hypothetical protein
MAGRNEVGQRQAIAHLMLAPLTGVEDRSQSGAERRFPC